MKTWPIPIWPEYWPWAKWRLAGAPDPMPDEARLLAARYHNLTGNWGVPPWAWDRLREQIRLRNKNQAPPPATDSDFWASQGGWTAWGLETNNWTPDTLFGKAAAHGFEWLGIQTTPYNLARGQKIRAAANAHGVKVVAWERCVEHLTPPDARIQTLQAHAFSANVEDVGPVEGSWEPYAAGLRLRNPRLPLSVFTNFAGTLARPDGTYDRELSRPWIDNNYAWITEAYVVNELGEQPTLAPPNLDWTAQHHGGVPKTYPAFGIYRCQPSRYDIWLEDFPFHSWYLLEYHPAFR